MIPEISVIFEPHDIWIGAYWYLTRSIESRYRKLEIYIAFVPMFPIRLRWEWGY